MTATRPLSHFWGRYRRWAVFQRCMVGRPVYALQAFLNPVPIAAVGFACDPGPGSMAILGAITVYAVGGAGAHAEYASHFLAPMADALSAGKWKLTLVAGICPPEARSLRSRQRREGAMELRDLTSQRVFANLFVYNVLYEDSEVDERHLGVNERSSILAISGAGCRVAGRLRAES